MSGSPQRVSSIVVGLAIALMAVIGAIGWRDSNDQLDAAASVEHTYRVLEQLQRIPAGLSAAESAMRGYMLSGNEAYLATFDPALRSSLDAFERVRELTADNPEQVARLAVLKPQITRRVEMLEARVRAVRANEGAHLTTEGRELTAQIVASIDAAIARERELLDEREATRDASTRAMQRLLAVGLLTSICLVGGATLLLLGESTRRRRSETRLADQARLLDRALSDISLMLEISEMLQACDTVDEAYPVLASLLARYFPNASGIVYLYQASRNAVEARAKWGEWPDDGERPFFGSDECWALRRGQPHQVDADNASLRCPHATGALQRASCCLPLLAHGDVLGMLRLSIGAKLDDAALRRALAVAEQVSAAIANLQLRDTLRNQSIRDPLTGLYNRRYGEETLQRELWRCDRLKEPLALLMLDVDHFKRFNDTFGHDAGDLVLRELASTLKARTRGSDIAIRLGGEELAVLLPGSDQAAALKKAEALRLEIGRLEVAYGGKQLGPVTVSVGVSLYPQHGASIEALFKRADVALYRAKHEGRDRVVLAD